MQPDLVVFPMAGLSRRFFDAGYTSPKYMLPFRGGSVFDACVGSFASLFNRARFLFVCTESHNTPDFVRERLAALGVLRSEVQVLDAPTRGQAETVSLALRDAEPASSLLIFNVDTVRERFALPDDLPWGHASGALEVVRLPGDQWSFVEPHPAEPGRVLRTAEKQRVSDLCSTGLYLFSRVDLYEGAYIQERSAFEGGRGQARELYIAPIYNHLIAAGHPIYFYEIVPDDMVCLGTPAEYETSRAASRP